MWTSAGFNHPRRAGLESATMPVLDFYHCIVFPIHDSEGHLVAYAGRSIDGSEPRYLCPPGFRKSQAVFNLHRTARECLAAGNKLEPWLWRHQTAAGARRVPAGGHRRCWQRQNRPKWRRFIPALTVNASSRRSLLKTGLVRRRLASRYTALIVSRSAGYPTQSSVKALCQGWMRANE